VVDNPQSREVLATAGVMPTAQDIHLKGIAERVRIYEIP